MSAIPTSLIDYLVAWNEPDPSLIRGHLERSVSRDVLFIDPAHTTRGIDELEEMIARGRADRPTGTYHRASGVDGHNRRYRYLWETRTDGEFLLGGMDVTTVDEKGAIVQIDGFFGEFPELET